MKSNVRKCEGVRTVNAQPDNKSMAMKEQAVFRQAATFKLSERVTEWMNLGGEYDI
jgi:hypothetical protein